MTCDASAGLYPVEGASGCYVRVLVTIADDWQVVGLAAVVLVLVALYALAVATLVRR